MAEQSYFTINNTDGDCYVQKCTKEEIERRLNEDEIGDFIIEFPGCNNTNYWHGATLIIKGTIIIPQASKFTVE